MTERMSREEIAKSLKAMGVDPRKADIAASADSGAQVNVGRVGYVQVVGPPLLYPICITIPWSGLVSDNAKYGVTIIRNSPRLILQAKYKEAKGKAARAAKDVMGDYPPLSGPLMLVGRIYVPDNRPGHDVCNVAKCLLDALQKVVYVNDDQLHRVTLLRAGVDVDRPRCELEIQPLAAV